MCCSLQHISTSLRSKRFRLGSEQRKTEERSVVIFKTRTLELYRSNEFRYLLTFCISLAFKCILIAVFQLF